MRLRLFAVSALAILAACGKAPSSTDQTAASDQGAASSAIAAAAASDQAAASDIQAQAALPSVPPSPKPLAGPDFVTMAAAGDMYEIAAAKLAETRSMNPKVVGFAKMMITDHSRSTARIKMAIAESGQGADLPLPKALPDDLQAKLDALKAASDSGFDKLYVQQQVAVHVGALNLMTGYAKSGDIPALKTAAKQIRPVVQMHLDRIKHLQTELGKD